MKTLISVLLVSVVSFLSNDRTFSNDSGCSCSNWFCSCESGSCEYTGGQPTCNCGVFSCNCGCTAAERVMPTTNDKQKQNSKAAQAYFKGLGTTQGATIAGYMETLSHAIADNNLELYAANAPLLEETFKNLTEAEQKAYMVWGVANLKPVKD